MSKIKKTAADQNKHEELENQLKRALADYQNLERRISEERTLLGSLTSAVVIEKFLPVLDNLESAQTHLNDEGLSLVIKQFKDILASENVEEVQAEGADFDPNLHEAIQTEEGPDDGKIVKVLANGYKMNDRVIRPAKVVVSRKSEAAQVDVQTEGGLNG